MTTLFVFESDLIGGVNLGTPPIIPGGKAWFLKLDLLDSSDPAIRFENTADFTSTTIPIPVDHRPMTIDLEVGKYIAIFNVGNQSRQHMHFTVSDKGVSNVFFVYDNSNDLFYPALGSETGMINIDTNETEGLAVQIILDDQFLKHGQSTTFFSGRIYENIALVGRGPYQLNVIQEGLDDPSQKPCNKPKLSEEIGGGTTIIIQEPPS